MVVWGAVADGGRAVTAAYVAVGSSAGVSVLGALPLLQSLPPWIPSLPALWASSWLLLKVSIYRYGNTRYFCFVSCHILSTVKRAEEALGKPLEWRAWQRLLPLPRLGRQSHNPP